MKPKPQKEQLLYDLFNVINSYSLTVSYGDICMQLEHLKNKLIEADLCVESKSTLDCCFDILKEKKNYVDRENKNE